ncbi:uncharacterized protein LOC103317856 [Nasonia vitripennis]|uniref:Uncharacterized protein n=1 Tax=Nasonia vitripennis TaxID=7425 RepID=A0A7M7HGC5_NASVI|nr:uncharacterized protein LOC103317856 [Nasonia vitripennis]
MHSPEDEDEEPEIASRISQLRAVLQELRLELYREKLNLQLEHHRSVGGSVSASCCWSIFNSAAAGGKEASLDRQSSPSNPVIVESEDKAADPDLAGFYKSKIDELEADCCEGLNRIRSRFTESSSSSSGSFDRLKAFDSGDAPSELQLLLLDSKSTLRKEEPVETLWTAIDEPFSEADFSSLMNE